MVIIIFFLGGLHSFSFGFSNILTSPEGYPNLKKPLNIQFPLDHGSHEKFFSEWWYITGNLIDQKGSTLGIQWTLFRNARDSTENLPKGLGKADSFSWDNKQIWMAHAAVTSERIHLFEEKLARGGSGQAGVKGNAFSAWIDDWSFSGAMDWSDLKVRAKGKNFEYSLNLEANGPIVLHGDHGYSEKTREGHNSAYYSQPFFKVNGKVIIGNETLLVNGSAWIDREWSSSILGPNQEGWDWFSLHLSDKEKLMLFRVRNKDSNHFHSGTMMTADNQVIHLKHDQIKITPLSDKNHQEEPGSQNSSIPTSWRLEIDSQDFEVIVKAINPNSYNDGLIPYWEGPINFFGSHEGVGYLEMTGY